MVEDTGMPDAKPLPFRRRREDEITRRAGTFIEAAKIRVAGEVLVRPARIAAPKPN